ncbi:MAG: peptidoglycan-binding protein [Alphaproteobacteria bacterium]
MAGSRSFDINALDEDTLQVARAAAEASGMSLEDWLARTLGDAIAQPEPDEASTSDSPFDAPPHGPGLASAPAEPVSPEELTTYMPGRMPAGGRFPPEPQGGPIDPDATVIAGGPDEAAASRPSPFAAAEPPRDAFATPSPGPAPAPFSTAPVDMAADGDLAGALAALAGSLASAVSSPRWSGRIDAVRRAAAGGATATPVAAAAFAAPRTSAAPPPLPETPPFAASMPREPQSGPREPVLQPPPAVPPAPAVVETPAPEPRSLLADETPAPGEPLLRPDEGDDELEQAIAAAQARRRNADGAAGRSRRRRGAGGWLVKGLAGVVGLAALAVVGVLGYTWLNPDTSIDQVTDDIARTADDAYQAVAGQIDSWLGNEPEQVDDGQGAAVPAEGSGGVDTATGPDAPAGDTAAASDAATTDRPDSTDDVATAATAETADMPAQTPPEPPAAPEASDTADAAGATRGVDAPAPAEPTPPPASTAAADDTPDTAVPPAADALPAEIAALQAQAEAGDAAAQRMLGQRYLNGDGVTPDTRNAYRWLEEAAVNADAEAQYLLGTLYEAGQGVDPDPLIAMAWYISASESGLPEASLRLGKIYRDGDLWPQNYDDAAELFRAAADARVAEAEYELAQLYDSGLGVDRSPLLAYLWFSRAAEQEFPQAAERVAALENRLSPDQLQTAREMMDAPPPTDTKLYGLQATLDGTIGSADQPAPDGAADGAADSQADAAAQPADSTNAAAQPPALGEPIAVPSTPQPATPGTGGQTIVVAPAPTGSTTPTIITVTPDATQQVATETTSDFIAPAPLSAAAIQEIQTILNALGYPSGSPDGVAGRRTAQAIRAYQTAEGLQPDGVPTLSLLARLRSEAR